VPELRGISGKALIAALARLGFVLVRQKGSHVALRRGADVCIVPLHDELLIGTLRGILRQARVFPEEVLDVLR